MRKIRRGRSLLAVRRLHLGNAAPAQPRQAYLEAGATLFGSKSESDFSTDALLLGEDLENISIEGRGTINGQAEYDWRMNVIDDGYIRDNQKAAEAAGVPLMRSFPKEMDHRKIYPHMIKLVRCKDIRVAGISIINSPSWTFYPYDCDRLRIDGIYIHTDQKYGVWADGIDPDGCRDVIIANSTIETGDDAIVFYSSRASGGPPKACENITVTNCRLSSSSSAIKFCDGNEVAVRNVTIRQLRDHPFQSRHRLYGLRRRGGGKRGDLQYRDQHPPLRLVLVGEWRSHLLHGAKTQRKPGPAAESR